MPLKMVGTGLRFALAVPSVRSSLALPSPPLIMVGTGGVSDEQTL